MGVKEVLSNLANLERELENIQSARILTENTVKSYQATQAEVSRLVQGLEGTVIALKAIPAELDAQIKELSGQLRAGASNIRQECEQAAVAFDKKSGEAIKDFGAAALKSGDSLRETTIGLTADYSRNNAALSEHIKKLEGLLEAYQVTSMNLKKELSEYTSLQNEVLRSSSALNDTTTGLASRMEDLQKEILVNKREVGQSLKGVAAYLASVLDKNVRDIKSDIGPEAETAINPRLRVLEGMITSLPDPVNDLKEIQKSVSDNRKLMVYNLVLVSIAVLGGAGVLAGFLMR